eukprot:SAG22_NODE_64_length_23238_cov_83.185566_11_plen_872_part_00
MQQRTPYVYVRPYVRGAIHGPAPRPARSTRCQSAGGDKARGLDLHCTLPMPVRTALLLSLGGALAAGQGGAAAAAPPPKQQLPNTPPSQQLPNTDWRDSLIPDEPLRETLNLTSCVAACTASPECVAVAWNPGMNQAQCQLKCAVRTSDRFYSPNCTGVLVRPGKTTCPLPTAYPGWMDARIARGDLLLAGPNEPGGHAGNGYVATYIQSLPGSIGPTERGVEHVAGVYAGSRTVLPLSNNPTDGRWPNKDCVSWCDFPHRAELVSFTSTARVDTIAGAAANATASAQDLANSAYYLVSKGTGPAASTTCVQRTYAHRGLMHLLISEFECTNTGTHGVTVTLREPGPSLIPLRHSDTPTIKAAPMGEVDYAHVQSGMTGVECSKVTIKVPEVKGGERTVVGECHSVCAGKSFVIAAGGKSVLTSCISARHSSVDQDAPKEGPGLGAAGVSSDADGGGSPVALAKASWQAANASSSSLSASHVHAQATTFAPGIEVGGNLALARVINASIEAMLYSHRMDAFPGAGSGGLASDAYAGNWDWDEETWFFPVFNWLWPANARQLLKYRIDRAMQARKDAADPRQFVGHRAPTGNRSFDGIAFPWFSALTAYGPPSGEDHLQGDIALAILQHWQSTGDVTWLKQNAFPVLEGLARFWVSRCDADADGTWHIRETMSPDEYAGNATDPPYTVVIAQISLRAAHDLAGIAGQTPNKTFVSVAEKLQVLYDPTLDYHPEHAGYKTGQTIKQADVVMLGYPLGYNMSMTTRRNDLEIYAKVTDPDGPGMTWAMHSIAYRDIGDEDLAAKYFTMGYESYVRGKFLTWHEGYGVFGGVTTFITGASGWLQSVIAGYGGVRLAANGDMQLKNPMPPVRETQN